MAASGIVCSHVAWLKHGQADVTNSTYGGHYRNEHGDIEESNLHVVARAPGDILGSIEDAVRETLRANPAQSKQQNSASGTIYDQNNPEDLGTVYVIAAPGGDRDVFLEADKKHKTLLALCQWCIDPKNKNKKEGDYKPRSATISNDVSAIEAVIKLLGAGWPSETLRWIFRGTKIAKAPKKVLDTLLRQKDDFGEGTLMVTTWNTYFPACGPTHNKFNIIRDNAEAAVMAFELRTSTTEAPSVSAQRALGIVTGASALTALPAPLKRPNHVQNFFSSAPLDSNKTQKTSGGGGASSGTNPREPGAAAPAASSSSAGAGAGADSGASAGSAICIDWNIPEATLTHTHH